jgi:hypothetical protein
MKTSCIGRIRAGSSDMSLAEALNDPLIRAVMAADHVDPSRLADELRETAHLIARHAA